MTSLSKKVLITLSGLPNGQRKWKDPWKGIKNKINWLFVLYCHFPPSTNPGIDVTPFDIGFINESNGFNNSQYTTVTTPESFTDFTNTMDFWLFSWGVIKKEMQIKIEHWHRSVATLAAYGKRKSKPISVVKANTTGETWKTNYQVWWIACTILSFILQILVFCWANCHIWVFCK